MSIVNRGYETRQTSKGRPFVSRESIASLRDIDRAPSKRAIQNNTADTNDLVFFGDDFDAILGILQEEEEELHEQFRKAADQVSSGFLLSHPGFSEKRDALTLIFFQLDRLSVLLCCSDLCYNGILITTCRTVLSTVWFFFFLSVLRTRLCRIVS